ncbi:MAG: GTP-binding protein [Methylobacter sp.]|nr:GTP-binding protein [Methylobacter sp.]MDP2429745.1 GTP-binding protein [Methylobacter sp.]MDP3055613.1 GTP-binding protein [Methylobacter sp.]MDP3361019.1 GTP-binding protein [Methylobacter sp.]MDZ4220938.1 GTP-binding protein [Methylobacter sp.]
MNNYSPTRPSKTIERIPVFIISGFLGSGKTTLLNRLLSHAPKSAVIINEFGTTPIDQQLLREHKVPLSTLVGGCLCCQVIGSLTPLLKNLRMAWDSKDRPFERVIIETSGVANPEPVLDILLRERWLAARYSLQGVITTVSAVMDEDYFDYFPEAQAACAWADTVVMTQTDLATAEQIERIGARLNQLAPAATRLTAVQGELDPELLLNFPRKFRRLRGTEELDLPDHGFSSISLQLEHPLPWERLQKALEYLVSHYPKQLVRLKGMVYTPGQNQPLLVQGAAGRLYPETRLPARASDDGIGRLVIITHGEVKALTEDLMAQLRAAPTN